MKLLIAFLTLAIGCFGADIAGKWNISAPTPNGNQVKYQLFIQVQGDSYSGTIAGDEGEVALRDIKVNGSELSFRIETDDARYDVTAAVDGDSIKGTYKVNGNAGGAFTGTRQASAKQTSAR